jgi:hypothetical protein
MSFLILIIIKNRESLIDRFNIYFNKLFIFNPLLYKILRLLIYKTYNEIKQLIFK